MEFIKIFDLSFFAASQSAYKLSMKKPILFTGVVVYNTNIAWALYE